MDWALLPLSTKRPLVHWSWESEARFHDACRHRESVVLSQHISILRAGPYCGQAVHGQMSSSRTSTVG